MPHLACATHTIVHRRYTGSILIAVNPFEKLPIYGDDKMPPYVNKALGLEEPHVYAMAEEAYKTLVKTKTSQSLVVSGESGAGKVSAPRLKPLTCRLAHVAASSASHAFGPCCRQARGVAVALKAGPLPDGAFAAKAAALLDGRADTCFLNGRPACHTRKVVP